MQNEYLNAILGGLLIGSASVLLLALAGRVAGISGILWGAVTRQGGVLWRWLFVLGLPLGTGLAHLTVGIPTPEPADTTPLLVIAAGLLVGMGVRLGNGCTSGHGVCGIGFSSRRSIAATLTFMATGIVTVFVVRHVVAA